MRQVRQTDSSVGQTGRWDRQVSVQDSSVGQTGQSDRSDRQVSQTGQSDRSVRRTVRQVSQTDRQTGLTSSSLVPPQKLVPPA